MWPDACEHAKKVLTNLQVRLVRRYSDLRKRARISIFRLRQIYFHDLSCSKKRFGGFIRRAPFCVVFQTLKRLKKPLLINRLAVGKCQITADLFSVFAVERIWIFQMLYPTTWFNTERSKPFFSYAFFCHRAFWFSLTLIASWLALNKNESLRESSR